MCKAIQREIKKQTKKMYKMVKRFEKIIDKNLQKTLDIVKEMWYNISTRSNGGLYNDNRNFWKNN